MPSPAPIRDRTNLLLHPRVQRTIATLAIGALLALAAGGWYAGAFSGGLQDADLTTVQTPHFVVDLNMADWPELAQLPGIGETLARRIVDSRRELGPFHSAEDLRRVRGLGYKTLDRVKPFLLIEPVRDIPQLPVDPLSSSDH